MPDTTFICFEYTKDGARIPNKMKLKLRQFFDKLDSLILGDPVLGDPSISLSWTIVDLFVRQLDAFEKEPIKAVKLWTMHEKVDMNNKARANLNNGLE